MFYVYWNNPSFKGKLNVPVIDVCMSATVGKTRTHRELNYSKLEHIKEFVRQCQYDISTVLIY